MSLCRYTDDDDERFWDAVDSLDDEHPTAAAAAGSPNHAYEHADDCISLPHGFVRRDILHRCNLHLKYMKNRPPFDGTCAEHDVEFNADLLKISMTNDQYWDLMLLLDWLAAYDELRISVALEKLVCCELSDDMLPPNRMCGFRKRYSDREPCCNFAMYASLPTLALNDSAAQDSDSVCEYRCGVHIDQTTSSHLQHCQPFALFEKQDFTSFVAEDDTLQGPSKPIPMFDTTEERTAFMMANAIFQLCFSDKSTSSASASSSLATGASGGSALHLAQSSSATISSASPSIGSPSASDDAIHLEQNAAHEASSMQPMLQSNPDDCSLNGDPIFDPVLRHAQTELRAFMEHLGVQYCLNSDCDVYGRPKPATHPLLSSYAAAYLTDIVRCCCLNKKKESSFAKSMQGAQRGKSFFGLVAHNLLEKCKEWLKHTTPQKGWLAYFTSWGKTDLMSPSKVASGSIASSRPASSTMMDDAHSISGVLGMPADLHDPEEEGDTQHGTSVDGSSAWAQQLCFKAEILRIEIHLLVQASEHSLASNPQELSPNLPNSHYPKSIALKFCGPGGQQPAFSLVHYSIQLDDELSDSASVSSSGRTRVTAGSGDSHRYNARNVESRTCILIAEIETSDVSRNLFSMYSLDRSASSSQQSESSNSSQTPLHNCPWSETFVPSHFEERNPGECFLYIDQVQFRAHSAVDLQEAPKLYLSINPRLIVLSPVDLVVLSEFFGQPLSVVFNYERKMAIKSSQRTSPPTLEEPTNIVSKNLAKLDVSIKLKAPRIIIPCKNPSLENSSWCVLVIDMASITLNSRYFLFFVLL